VHRRVGCGVIHKGHICGFLKCILVVLDGGNKRADGVVCLCARFGAKLVRGESVVGLGVCRNTGYQETFKEFGQGVIEIYAPVGGGVRFVFSMSFVDWLHEGELPIGRLHVGFPYTVEE